MPLQFGRHTLATRPELVAEWKEKSSAMSLVSISNLVDTLCARDSLRDRLGDIRQPALVIVGEEDISLPPPCSARMAERLPNGSLQVIKRAGHLSALEQSEAVTAAMLTFMASHRQRRDWH